MRDDVIRLIRRRHSAFVEAFAHDRRSASWPHATQRILLTEGARQPIPSGVISAVPEVSALAPFVLARMLPASSGRNDDVAAGLKARAHRVRSMSC